MNAQLREMGRHKKKKPENEQCSPQVRVKLHVGGDAIGPGKIDLLRFIDSEGGISPAARKMGITFRRAWYLIDTMNSAFGKPVVETKIGGSGGGGARLTDLGRNLLRRYDTLIAEIDPSTKRVLAWVEKSKGD